MVSEDRNDRIEDLLIDYHINRAIPSACEACDLLFEELMSPEGDEEGEEKMCKKIEVEEDSKEKQLRDLEKKRKEAKEELEAAKEKVAGIEDEMQDLLKDILNEKIVVIHKEVHITPAPITIIEPRRNWPYGWDVWC